MKNTSKFRAQRDREFQELFNETYDLMLKRKVKNPRREALRFTLCNGSPHYHVSFDRAYIVVPQILRSGKMPIGRAMAAQMWSEISQRVRQLMTDHNMSIAAALEFVLMYCRASRFFMTDHYASCRFRPLSRRQRLLRTYRIA